MANITAEQVKQLRDKTGELKKRHADGATLELVDIEDKVVRFGDRWRFRSVIADHRRAEMRGVLGMAAQVLEEPHAMRLVERRLAGLERVGQLFPGARERRTAEGQQRRPRRAGSSKPLLPGGHRRTHPLPGPRHQTHETSKEFRGFAALGAPHRVVSSAGPLENAT